MSEQKKPKRLWLHIWKEVTGEWIFESLNTSGDFFDGYGEPVESAPEYTEYVRSDLVPDPETEAVCFYTQVEDGLGPLYKKSDCGQIMNRGDEWKFCPGCGRRIEISDSEEVDK